MDYIYCQFFKTECRFHSGFSVDLMSPAKELYLLRNKGNIFGVSYIKGDDIAWPKVKCVGQSQIIIGAWENLFCQHYIIQPYLQVWDMSAIADLLKRRVVNRILP